MRWKELFSKTWPFLFLLLVSALAYLPLVTRFSYTFDDWYLMWSAKAYGPQAFFPIFSIDRPLRAYLMYPLYSLYGENPLWYNLSAFALRLAGALCFGWMLRMLWPRVRAASWGMALLFVIYPGFLSQPNAIDYQSHIAALTLAMLSLALMVRALTGTDSSLKRAALLVLSALTGWLYLGLMEYYIGFELIRVLLVGLLALRLEQGWLARLKKAALTWLPLAIVPLGFVYWRVFIFVGERKATDANAQLASAMSSPLRAVFAWAVGLLNDIFQTTLMAWITPLAQLWSQLTVAQILIGLTLGLVAAALAWRFFADGEADSTWRAEAIWLGAAAIVAGLIPVVLANRGVAFPYYSRYTLIASTGVAMLAVALISMLPGRVAPRLALSALTLLAVLTHFANSVGAANQTAAMQNFWWQVAWRAPMLAKNTTLVAQWPNAIQQEDYFVWGPANLIYYPAPQNVDYIQPGVYAAILTPQNVQRILDRERQVYDNRRTIRTFANFRNILIFDQPTTGACVHALDNKQLQLSAADDNTIRQIAPFSEIEHILPDASPQTPPRVVFGLEPAHGWCYYYQKASLAQQRGQWAEVAALGEQAKRQGLEAKDRVEWMPFLQAYAQEGDVSRLMELSPVIAADPYAAEQACQFLGGLQGLSEPVSQVIRTDYCPQ